MGNKPLAAQQSGECISNLLEPKCNLTKDHCPSFCVSESHAEQIEFVWVEESCVLVNADLNINDEYVRN